MVFFQSPGFIDDLWLRFPDILGNVLGNLDNQSIIQCLMVNKTWNTCIKRERILWHRREKEISKKEKALARREFEMARKVIEGNLEVSYIMCNVCVHMYLILGLKFSL